MRLKRSKIISIFVAAFLLIALCITVGFNWLLETIAECNEDIFSQIYSPDKKYIGQYYSVDCGATTGFSRSVRIIDTQDPFAYPKGCLKKILPGIYKLNFEGEGTVFDAKGQAPITLKWQNSRTLLITYPKDTAIDAQDKQWHDVKILYAPQ